MSVSYTFERDDGGVDRLLHTATGPTGQWMTRLVNTAVNEVKARANVDTGYMRSRIEGDVVVEQGRIVGIVAARTPYAAYVNARFYFMEAGVEAAIQQHGG